MTFIYGWIGMRRFTGLTFAISTAFVAACGDFHVVDPLVPTPVIPLRRAWVPLDDVVITASGPAPSSDWDWYWYAVTRAAGGMSSDYYDDYLGGGSGGSYAASNCPRGGIPESGCALQFPSPTEMEAFQAEASRLEQPTNDEVCRTLGRKIREELANVRMHAYAYRARNPYTGEYGSIVGQYWTPTSSAPAEIHIARNINTENGRSQADLNSTLRHEFAHALGYQDPESPGAMAPYAHHIAEQCAPAT